MIRPSSARLAWLLLLSLGCGGLTGGGGCGGCGGCEAIPGGFPADQRANNAVSVALSRDGLDTLEKEAGSFLSGNGGSNISYAVDCSQTTQSLLGLDFYIRICDTNASGACDPGDASAYRAYDPRHGYDCGLEASIEGLDLSVSQAQPADPVSLNAGIAIKANTGKIIISLSAPPKTAFGQTIIPACEDVRCSVEFDTDVDWSNPSNPLPISPGTAPVNVALKLRTDAQWEDRLALDFADPNDPIDLSSVITSSRLHISAEPGGTCTAANRLGVGSPEAVCGLLDNNIVKNLILNSLKGQISGVLSDQVDAFRCQPCEPVTDACPTGSTCQNKLCYLDSADPSAGDRRCVPAKLGIEGRADLGATLASFGGKQPTLLDVSVLGGGRYADGNSATRVTSKGSLVVGVMGGTQSPEPSACVPFARWAPRPVQSTLDFDAEATTAQIGKYDVAFSLGDHFLDKSLYDVWRSGAVCLDVGQQVTTLLSSQLFATFIRTLPAVTHGEDVPMLIALRPRNPPEMTIGLGTTKPGPNGTLIPDDPLLKLEMTGLYIDFYAFLEERYTRLFSLTADMALPLGLDVDTTAGTIQPVLAGLDTLLTNVKASNIELLTEDPAALEAVVPAIIGLIQPQLAGLIAPIALPEVQGFKVALNGRPRGAVKYAGRPGYEHLVLFAGLEKASAQPLVMRAETEASISELRIPSGDEAFHGAPVTAQIRARAIGTLPSRTGWQFATRVDGGLWGPWSRSADIEVSSPVLRLQGRHVVEVRARAGEDSSTADLSPVGLPVVVDYDPPSVQLRSDADAGVLVTRAHDAVTPDASLRFRYRLDGGTWSDLGSARTFPIDSLGEDSVVEVEVQDEAGHSAAAKYGSVAEAHAPRGVRTGEAHDEAGCSAVNAGAFAALALLVRRRSRR